jgi:hypothetical protein
VSWLGNLALPELGTAQPQLVYCLSKKQFFTNLKGIEGKKTKIKSLLPSTCPPPLHTKRSLESNTNFTFQALPGSVLKLETSCQKGKCCQGPSDTSWLVGFWPRVYTGVWSRDACFDCFFHNLVNFWNFSFFSGPRYICRFKRRE